MSLLYYELLQENLSFLMELAPYFANTLLMSLSVGLTSLEQHDKLKHVLEKSC